MKDFLDSNGFSDLIEELPDLYGQLDIIDYTFVIWTEDFSYVDPPVGALLVKSVGNFGEIMQNRDNPVFLRKKPNTPENPSIEDDFDCIWLQENPSDNASAACIKEKGDHYSDCQYWQKCYFTAAYRGNCSIVVIKVAALAVCLVLLVLIIFIFSIYWFKKKLDRSQVEEDRNVTPPNDNTEFNEYNQ